MLVLLDNYDSFTYNLYHFLGELGAKMEVWRHDAITVPEVMDKKPAGIVISPGPCDPDKAGISLDLIKAAAGTCPILGVCLGHQAIAQSFGGVIERSSVIMHGKLSDIHHDGTGLFNNLPSPFRATRYHSLVAQAITLPDCLQVNARTDDGTIMGIRHKSMPVHGLQFHPESIESEHGHALLDAFLDLCADPERGPRLRGAA